MSDEGTSPEASDADAAGRGASEDLAATLLHRPRPTDDKPGVRWAYRPWLMLLMSLAIAYHVTVLLVHNLPGKGLAKDVHSFFNDKFQAGNYMRAVGLTQSWAMFAPNPHRSNMFMKVLVKDRDGEIWDLGHDIYGRRTYPYMFYDRMGKINRRLIEEKGYRRHYAAWVCRQWEMDHEGEPADEVQFVKMWTQVPPPEKVFKRASEMKNPWQRLMNMGYDPMALHLNQREEETIRCSSTYQAQLPPELRERLGLPENPDSKYRDVYIRTWWDSKKAKEKQAEREAERGDDDVSAPEQPGEVEGGE